MLQFLFIASSFLFFIAYVIVLVTLIAKGARWFRPQTRIPAVIFVVLFSIGIVTGSGKPNKRNGLPVPKENLADVRWTEVVENEQGLQLLYSGNFSRQGSTLKTIKDGSDLLGWQWGRHWTQQDARLKLANGYLEYQIFGSITYQILWFSVYSESVEFKGKVEFSDSW